MIIKYLKHFPPKGFTAICLFGIIVARKEYAPLNKEIINHERIHARQMMEMCYIFFYLWYGIEWCVGMIRHRNSMHAYYNISFEREAYAHGSDLAYLRRRKFWAWCKYL